MSTPKFANNEERIAWLDACGKSLRKTLDEMAAVWDHPEAFSEEHKARVRREYLEKFTP